MFKQFIEEINQNILYAYIFVGIKYIYKENYISIFMKYLNLKIDEKLLKKFKKYCIDINSTMTAKITELIENELQSTNQPTKKIKN